MTKMLLFENGQFPFYVFGFRASKNFQDVVGLDPGRINVAPLGQYLCRVCHQYDQSGGGSQLLVLLPLCPMVTER